TRSPHRARCAALATAALPLIAVAACSSGTATSAAPGASATQSGSASGAPQDAGQAAAVSGDGCTLVTPAELSAAVGVTYRAIADSNGICNVTGASPADSFYFHLDHEDGTLTTWKSEVAVIKEDDGSVTSVPGLGDQAAQGAIKEFAAET